MLIVTLIPHGMGENTELISGPPPCPISDIHVCEAVRPFTARFLFPPSPCSSRARCLLQLSTVSTSQPSLRLNRRHAHRMLLTLAGTAGPTAHALMAPAAYSYDATRR